jgi:hypothetical protein
MWASRVVAADPVNAGTNKCAINSVEPFMTLSSDSVASTTISYNSFTDEVFMGQSRFCKEDAQWHFTAWPVPPDKITVFSLLLADKVVLPPRESGRHLDCTDLSICFIECISRQRYLKTSMNTCAGFFCLLWLNFGHLGCVAPSLEECFALQSSTIFFLHASDYADN